MVLNLSWFFMLEEILKSCTEHEKGTLGGLRIWACYIISFSRVIDQNFLLQSQLHQL